MTRAFYGIPAKNFAPGRREENLDVRILFRGQGRVLVFSPEPRDSIERDLDGELLGTTWAEFWTSLTTSERNRAFFAKVRREEWRRAPRGRGTRLVPMNKVKQSDLVLAERIPSARYLGDPIPRPIDV